MHSSCIGFLLFQFAEHGALTHAANTQIFICVFLPFLMPFMIEFSHKAVEEDESLSQLFTREEKAEQSVAGQEPHKTLSLLGKFHVSTALGAARLHVLGLL